MDQWEFTKVEDYAGLGAASTILPGITIGKYARVGAGAVVTKDIEAGTVVMGVPAKTTGTRTEGYMLTKRRIIVLAITGVMAALITGGAVFAQGSDTDRGMASQSFAARLAAILELEEAPVQAALQQVRGEIRDERFQMKLDRLVEQGRLNQEQADELRNWYDSRPDYPAGAFLGSGKGGGGHSLHGRGSFGSPWGHFGQFRAIPEAAPSDSGGSSTSY